MEGNKASVTTRTSNINIVDLAGSEPINAGDGGTKINGSLVQIGMDIRALQGIRKGSNPNSDFFKLIKVPIYHDNCIACILNKHYVSL